MATSASANTRTTSHWVRVLPRIAGRRTRSISVPAMSCRRQTAKMALVERISVRAFAAPNWTNDISASTSSGAGTSRRRLRGVAECMPPFCRMRATFPVGGRNDP